jgi:hypothetical protein
MDIQSILDKGEGAELSKEEIQTLTSSFMTDLDALKESNPEQYLILVKQVNKSLKELNSTLRKV